MAIRNDVILYRAHRLRFITMALLVVPFTVAVAALGYDAMFLGDSEVQGGWMAIPLGALFVWMDYVIITKIVRPPELEISLRGIRWSNYSMMEPNHVYGWQDFSGPEQGVGGYGVPLLQIVVNQTGRKLKLPPSHFGATYNEMAEVISAARSGRLISLERWRLEHPQHPLRQWLINWGIPLSLGVVAAIVLGWFKR